MFATHGILLSGLFLFGSCIVHSKRKEEVLDAIRAFFAQLAGCGLENANQDKDQLGGFL